MPIKPTDLARALHVLVEGGIIAYPTDTAYGLGADTANPAAIKKLFTVKGRDFKKPVSVLAADLAQAEVVGVFDDRARRVWRSFMPGPLTIIVPVRPELAGDPSWRLLSAGSGTIGIRMPDYAPALILASKLGRPITTTSANIAGQPTAYSASEAADQFKGVPGPDYILDGGRLSGGAVSTVIEVSAQGIKVVRPGVIPAEAIMQALL